MSYKEMLGVNVCLISVRHNFRFDKQFRELSSRYGQKRVYRSCEVSVTADLS
jgi:hypothetical protein